MLATAKCLRFSVLLLTSKPDWVSDEVTFVSAIWADCFGMILLFRGVYTVLYGFSSQPGSLLIKLRNRYIWY